VLRQPNHDQRLRPWQPPVLLVCLGLSAYFAYHAINGRHGLEVRKQLAERSSVLEFEVRSLEAVRARLERDVALLSPDLPNPDIVEEIARDVLGFTHPSDRVLVRAPDAEE
jgi:cell division protein FtsB